MDNSATQYRQPDPGQDNALEFMRGGGNCLITGPAGTGKTTILERFVKRARGNVVVLAPTGIAALKVNGQTVHRFFGLRGGVATPDMAEHTDGDVLHMCRFVDTIVIEESSMLRSDIFFAINRIMQKAQSPLGQSVYPFGGVQVIMLADYCQLPPVVDNDNLAEYLRYRHGSVFTFKTLEWALSYFHIFRLKQNHRQMTDPAFQSALNTIRLSDTRWPCTGLDESIEWINENAHIGPPPGDRPVLCPTVRQAELYNMKMDSKIRGFAKTFRGRIYGTFPRTELPVPEEQTYRVGSYVMVRANATDGDNSFTYVNGSRGRIIDIDWSMERVWVQLEDGAVVMVTPHFWEKWRYDFDPSPSDTAPSIRQEREGFYRQMPLIPAYATTIHKAQGLTLTSGVHLSLERPPFASGQLYVGLGRVPSVDKLSLGRPITRQDVNLNWDVAEFYRKLG